MDEADDIEFEELAYQECGRWANGALLPSCRKAGSEECDWECPLHDQPADSEAEIKKRNPLWYGGYGL
ncbi:MAG: hypothetical protein AAGD43_26190 [Pseudomonadota bacterium]